MTDRKAERNLFDPESYESRCPICTRARQGNRLARMVQRLGPLPRHQNRGNKSISGQSLISLAGL